MLLDKYRPKTSRDIIGNGEQIHELADWLRRWKSGALILWGPLGCGKSLALALVAKELGYDVVESHASDLRNKDTINDMITSSKQRGVFAKKRIIIVDDLEVFESKASLLRLIKESMNPVVLVAENPYILGMPAIVKACKLVRFNKVEKRLVLSFLARICARENIGAGKEIPQAIADSSDGDVRSALIDLESAVAARQKVTTVFEDVRDIFKGRKHEVDAPMLPWISENIPNEFREKDEIASAYRWLAKADLFVARVSKRQSWNLLKYASDLVCYGMPLSKKSKKLILATYRPPAARASSAQTLEKIAEHNHISMKNAHQFMPLLKTLVDDKEFCGQLGLDENDAEFISSFK